MREDRFIGYRVAPWTLLLAIPLLVPIFVWHWIVETIGGRA